MRLLYTLITVLLVTSCGTGKIRFVRHQKIIETNETQASCSENENIRETNTESTPAVNEEKIAHSSDDPGAPSDEYAFIESPDVLTPTDSTKANAIENEVIEYQALQAEKDAKLSTIFSPLFPALVGLGILISFFTSFGISAAIGLGLGLISMVFGIVFYARAARSRYITQKGDRHLKTALVLMIVNLSIIFLYAVLLLLAFL